MKWGKAFLLLFLWSVLLSSCAQTVARYDNRLKKRFERKGFRSNIVEKDNRKLFYWDNQVEKPPLIFIHGFGGDGKISWSRQIKDFKDDYRVIVPDILWFGQSYSNETPSLQAQIEAIQMLIEELSLEQVNLVGISYGGFISLGMGYFFPEKLKRIVIVNSPGAVITDDEIYKFCQKIGVRNINEAFVPKTGKDVKRLLNFSFYKKPPIPNFLMDQILEQYFSKNPIEQNKLLDELPENRERLKGEIDVPVSIIWGMEDEVFSVYDAYTLKNVLNADLKVIKGAGHALPGEKPKAFNEALSKFLKQ